MWSTEIGSAALTEVNYVTDVPSAVAAPEDTIPFIDLRAQYERLKPAIDQAIARVLEHGKYIMGPEVAELEEQLAERAQVDHVITCSSGTDALLLALMAWEIGPGDAVFIPSFTFTATAEVVALTGATTVFCDVDERTFNLSPTALERAIETMLSDSTLTPKAVIAVDLFGQPADYPSIREITDRYHLKLLGDAAQSFGGSQHGRPVGSLADVTATSFFPAKPLGCYGDGGAVFTDDPDIAAVIRSLRVHGQGSNKYDTVRVGLTARLDSLQAAILLQKLTVFDEEIVARQAVAERYSRELGGIVDVPVVAADNQSVWAQYTIATDQRDQLSSYLRDRDVPSAVYYPSPLHRQGAYQGPRFVDAGAIIAERHSQRVLSLPMGPYLTDSHQGRVIDEVRRHFY